MVAWFAGLFYLPRLFVYHANSSNVATNDLFKIMEKKLYKYIMTPAAILTTIFGLWLLIEYSWVIYKKQMWLHLKLSLVMLLWLYHIYCGILVKKFASGNNKHSSKFYRFFNEIPTLFLISIVMLVVLKP
tara:strand:+ start:1878 stop:2267 length:390 start_codon:yes stop_codon:yes gene_type:complete